MPRTSDAHHDLDPGMLRQVLPNGPGVYLFKDSGGQVVYVGKAKSLKKRVLSYFRAHANLSDKTALMMKRAAGLDYFLTATEKEAFILENTLIKKFMPRYNVILRDDKQYPCLRLDTTVPYPRLGIVRKIKKDGALYFGPFSSAHSVRSTLKVVDRVFQLRKCRRDSPPIRTRACINYQMGRCLGPCTHPVSASQYASIVEEVRFFLEGRNQELISRLKGEMGEAADRLDFEKAARVRDQITAIENTVEHQHVVSTRMEDRDVIGLVQRKDLYQVVLLFVRKGKVVGSRDYLFKEPGARAAEVMEAFLKQHYHREVFIPRQILISEKIEDTGSITEWLSDRSGSKVIVHRPVRGEKHRLITMALANAESLLAGHEERQKEDLMSLVQSTLGLKRPPRLVEGFDISNLQGDMAVGTVVSFFEGLPHRSGYRNYKIKAVEGIDDYGMMAELVSRRLTREPLPDLFLVDGGKGHLSVVMTLLARQPGGQVPEVVSIAKAEERQQERGDKLYLPGRKNPLLLRADHPVLLLMMRIRDEAHRRAISYHRRLRKAALTKSQLDLIPGVGGARKRRLLRYFDDADAVSGASVEELTRVSGISRALAETIFNFFRDTRESLPQGKRNGEY